jgi:hypothetical protein
LPDRASSGAGREHPWSACFGPIGIDGLGEVVEDGEGLVARPSRWPVEDMRAARLVAAAAAEQLARERDKP